MMKRLAIIMALMFASMSASAQVATPRLDRLMKVQSPAAAGWRDGTTVALQGASAEGKLETDGTEIGDIKIGLAAESSLPAIVAAYKGEEIGVELYYNAGTAKNGDMDMADQSNMPASYILGNVESEDDLSETRLNLAYVFGEALSIGLGYRMNETKNETTQAGNVYAFDGTSQYVLYTSFSSDSSSKTTETGLMVNASLQLAEMFYISGGLENVSYKTDAGGSDIKNDWQNMILGLGVLVGEPGDSRFRAEYAMITSPEKENSDKDDIHPKTDYSSLSLEALFGNFLLSYVNETEKASDVDDTASSNEEAETITTSIGLGWMPEEGLAVSVYSWTIDQTFNKSGYEIETKPTGWRLSVGWNF